MERKHATLMPGFSVTHMDVLDLGDEARSEVKYEVPLKFMNRGMRFRGRKAAVFEADAPSNVVMFEYKNVSDQFDRMNETYIGKIIESFDITVR